MADELLRRAARAINDLRLLANTLNNAGYPGSSIRLQGFAGLLKGLEGELVHAQAKLDAEQITPANVPVSCRFATHRGSVAQTAKTIAILVVGAMAL